MVEKCSSHLHAPHAFVALEFVGNYDTCTTEDTLLYSCRVAKHKHTCCGCQSMCSVSWKISDILWLLLLQRCFSVKSWTFMMVLSLLICCACRNRMFESTAPRSLLCQVSTSCPRLCSAVHAALPLPSELCLSSQLTLCLHCHSACAEVLLCHLHTFYILYHMKLDLFVVSCTHVSLHCILMQS